jgi:ABC-type uncharacterized transport system substrate-binding protein
VAPVHSDAEIETVIASLSREPGGGLIVMPDGFLQVHRAPILLQATRNNFPAIYQLTLFVRDGGLLSYGPDGVDMYRRAAAYVDRILRGAKPGASCSVADQICDGCQRQDRQRARPYCAAIDFVACRRGYRMIKRRTFIAGLGSTAAWPVVARGQQPALPVIGLLMSTSREANLGRLAAFREGLSKTGYVEMRNVAIEYRSADGQYERLPALAAELVHPHVNAGLVANLAQPGGHPATETALKDMQTAVSRAVDHLGGVACFGWRGRYRRPHHCREAAREAAAADCR